MAGVPIVFLIAIEGYQCVYNRRLYIHTGKTAMGFLVKLRGKGGFKYLLTVGYFRGYIKRVESSFKKESGKWSF